MKKILSVLLVLCFLLSICACNQTKQQSPNQGTENTTDVKEEEEEEEEEPFVSQEDQIKQNVLDLMKKSDEQKDPATLFSYFDGDYEISKFTRSNDAINTVKRKNAVTLVSAGGIQYYGVEAAGYLFYVADYDGESAMVGDISLQADNAEKSTIFTTFGIDTGAVYGVDAEDEPIELTADMLTVSEDKTTCTFSREYVDEIAKMLCDAMGFTEAQTASFLKKYKGSGSYSVSENKITFEISIKDTSLGNITQKTTYSIDDGQKMNAYSFLEYSNPTLGIKTPVISEITYKDVVYEGNEPKSATIQLKTVSDISFYYGDYYDRQYISATQTEKTTFTLDCSDAAHPKGSAVCEKSKTETFQNETSTFNLELRMSVDLGKSTSQFTFAMKENGETLTSIKANKVVFATPTAFPAVPQRVTNCITNYINNKFN